MKKYLFVLSIICFLFSLYFVVLTPETAVSGKACWWHPIDNYCPIFPAKDICEKETGKKCAQSCGTQLPDCPDQ